LSPEEAREMGRRKRAEIARAQAVENGTAEDPIGGLTEALGSTTIKRPSLRRRRLIVNI